MTNEGPVRNRPRAATFKRAVRALRPLPLALLAALVGGCERPFVQLDPPAVEVVSPDLGVVQTAGQLPLALRVTAARGVARVEVNGEEAGFNGELGLYLDTLALAPGLNTILVGAVDGDGNAGRDTLYALRLGVETTFLALELPEPLAGHTATLLDDGRALVVGGAGRDGRARARAAVFIERGLALTVESLPSGLGEARAGHTASRLPDGRVLVVGGSSSAEPQSPSDFVTTAEVFDPTTSGFAALPFRGEPIRRAQHTATVLSDGARTFVYLYGGRAPLGSGVGTLSSLTILELRQTAAGDSLLNLSPAGGVGALAPAAGHVQLSLEAGGLAARTLVAGAYAPPDDPANATALAFRLLYQPSSLFFPFEVIEQPVEPPRVLLNEQAGAALADGLLLLAGGRTPEGAVRADLVAFADGASRFFRFPDGVALRTPRRRHTATRMPSGRILVAGGLNAAGTTLASTELVLTTD